MKTLSLFAVINLPVFWPPRQDHKAGEQAGDDTILQFWYTATGRIHAVAMTLDGSTKLEVFSPEIQPINSIFGLGRVQAILSIILNGDTREIKLSINGSDAVASDPPLRLHATPLLLDSLKLHTPIGEDHNGLKDVSKKRLQRARDYQRSGLTLKQIAQRWEDLRRECRLLRRAIERLRAGEHDDVVTVSVHLRKLIGHGKGNHVLQDCAGFDNKALPVWTRPPADSNLWTLEHLTEGPPHLWEKEMFSPSQQPFETYRTDLDVWLEQNAGIIGGKKLTNMDKMLEVADKIGAHLDMKNRSTVEVLQSFHFGDVSALARYLITFGMGVLSVADVLIGEHDRASNS